jgi:hypothetical protein
MGICWEWIVIFSVDVVQEILERGMIPGRKSNWNGWGNLSKDVVIGSDERGCRGTIGWAMGHERMG